MSDDPSGSDPSSIARDFLGNGTSSEEYCVPNSGVHMADTSMQVTEQFLDEMISVGIDTVARYYDHPNETLPGKTLTAQERSLLTSRGLKTLVVFQHNNNQAQTFIDWKRRGPQDALRALDLASKLSQPPESTIYFGVDQDFVGSIPGYTFYNDEVRGYFGEINETFEARGAKFRIGAYGSGECLRVLYSEGLVTMRWLSHSRGFVGSKEALRNGDFDVAQLLDGRCGGREVDFNVRRKIDLDVGQF